MRWAGDERGEKKNGKGRRESEVSRHLIATTFTLAADGVSPRRASSRSLREASPGEPANPVIFANYSC